ncbi:transcriptional regulator, HxlR family [Lentzea aerocolonigenes]|nr:helix-turn-helix domain-containing protein [Lentzea aerocolonigenes]MCP2241545.1 transcriptional regulator, HxlR family [Lentzea aerocolonigenes]
MFSGCEEVSVPVRIGDKWTGKILVCLKDGKRRFSELQVPLQGVTPKVLTESLRAMERDGFLLRHAHPEVPPRVEYEITDLGRTLLELMETTCDWTAAHLTELLQARRAYQERAV